MNADGIRLLYAYNDWSNHRILAACARVSAEQYAAPASFGTGYGSLRATLVHLLDAECLWRHIFQGGAPADWRELTEADFPALDGLQARWQAEQRELQAYIEALRDEQLNGTLSYRITTGTLRERVLWHCLLHLVNHGTQHRGEAAALLTGYGQSPGDLDFTLFLNEHFNLPS